MLHVIIGILIVIGGFMTALKSEWLLRQFGRVDWAENRFPFEGGTRFFYKLLGIIIIFFGLFIMTGIWTDILNAIFRLFGGRR